MTDTMIETVTPYRSTMPPGRDGFWQLLRAEWTKFRTVRGWLIGSAAVAVFMVLFGLLGAAGSRNTYSSRPGGADIVGHPPVPTGPDGEAVTDSFYFVHQSLDGDASITVRVTSLTAVAVGPGAGAPASSDGTPPSAPDASTPTTDAVQPWTKAGLIIKENTQAGSAYAAIMVTGDHGVRMQYNYTGDTAGPAGAVSASSPRWLRLTRAGDTFTGYASTDGTVWTTVGTVALAGLPSTALAGMFVASPGQQRFDQYLGGFSSTGSPTLATATFDTVDVRGQHPGDTWSGRDVGVDPAGAGTKP